MPALEWSDPPTTARGVQPVYDAEIYQLKQHHGKWAILERVPLPPEGDEHKVAANRARAKMGSLASRIREGRLPGFTKGEFESMSRTVDNEVRVYVRYVGEL